MMTTEPERRPVYLAGGEVVPGLTIAGDDASATFYIDGVPVSEERAAEYMDRFEREQES